VLAKALGPWRIRVNSINPDGVQTQKTREAGIVGSEAERDTVARTPMGRFGLPNDIAPIAVFLASP
jgi:3-oxoacyl-[acyl-carrier protein] reductase